MTGTRWVALLAISFLLTVFPSAAASASLDLAGTGTSWNGAYESTDGMLWTPPGARLHGVEAVPTGAPITSWRAQENGAIVAQLPAGASGARVTFDLQANPVRLARFVAPADIDALAIRVAAPPGMIARADETALDESGRANLTNVRAGQSVTLRSLDADRVDELGIVITLVGLAGVVFVGTMLYHKLRPPLGGKRPEKFLEHLSELQSRLVPPILVFGALNLYYFTSGLRRATLLGIPVVRPTFSVDSSLAARAFDAFTERLVPAGVQLIVTKPADAVVAEVQMAFFLSFITVLPLLLYEIAVFIGPALSQRQRRTAIRVIPIVMGLFLVGVAFAYLYMAPFMLRTLYDFAPTLGATPLLGISDLVGFVVITLLSFGAAFELPVVMHLLTRFGIVRAATWRKYLRHAIVIIVLVAGFITPDPSVVSQVVVSVPILGLYLLGMLAATVAERREAPGRGAAGA